MIAPGSALIAKHCRVWLMLAPSASAWRTAVPFNWGLCIATSTSNIFANETNRIVDYAYVLDSLTMRLGWVFAHDVIESSLM